MALSKFVSLIFAVSSITVPYILYKIYKWTKSVKKFNESPSTSRTSRKLTENPSQAVISYQDEGESLDETTAQDLFTLLCCDEDCRMELFVAIKRLGEIQGKSLDDKEILTVVKTFPEMFQVVTVDECRHIIEAKSAVTLCDAFQLGMCLNPNCNQLHICRFFLQDRCKFGENCTKPHTFDSPQNKNVLEENKLNLLPPDALRNLFNKILNLKIIKHTSVTSGPLPCKFYNKSDCKNGDKCEFLHVCEYYVDGYCRFGEDRCIKDHHFGSPQSRRILEAHGLGGLRRNEILTILRKRSGANLSDCSDLSSFDEHDEIFL